jgi:hypothetical protein
MAGMTWIIAPEPVDSPVAAALWREYYTEVSDRWYLLHEGRRTDPAELERSSRGTTVSRPAVRAYGCWTRRRPS